MNIWNMVGLNMVIGHVVKLRNCSLEFKVTFGIEK